MHTKGFHIKHDCFVLCPGSCSLSLLTRWSAFTLEIFLCAWAYLHLHFTTSGGYALSWFANKTRHKKKIPVVSSRHRPECLCIGVKQIHALILCLLFLLLLMQITTIWLPFKLQHLLCIAMLWFNHEGWSNTTAVHILVWTWWFQTWFMCASARLLPNLILARLHKNRAYLGSMLMFKLIKWTRLWG